MSPLAPASTFKTRLTVNTVPRHKRSNTFLARIISMATLSNGKKLPGSLLANDPGNMEPKQSMRQPEETQSRCGGNDIRTSGRRQIGPRCAGKGTGGL